jgi:hypothetical protein
MPKTPKQTPTKTQPENEAAIMERMNKALKRMMDTPPETHKEMVSRRRGKTPPTGRRQGGQK